MKIIEKSVEELTPYENNPRKNDSAVDAVAEDYSSDKMYGSCFMCELDPHYCDVIINRWETLTGQKAVLLND